MVGRSTISIVIDPLTVDPDTARCTLADMFHDLGDIEVDPISRTVRVYTADDEGTLLDQTAILHGESVLPGFRLSLADLFTRAEQTP